MSANSAVETQKDPNVFPLREAHALVRDLMQPNPRIYWLDFGFHVCLGWAALVVTVRAPWLSAMQIVGWIVAALALYRSVIFVHELAHLKRGTFRAFRWVWNILCGAPLMVPSYMYDGVHNDHHIRDTYGTAEDGEYVAFARGTRLGLIGYVLQSFVLPWGLLARFLILAPLSWVIPPLRGFNWRHLSSLQIDMNYVRGPDTIRNDHHWRVQEAIAALVALAAFAAMIVGVLPWKVLWVWYAVAVLMFILNSLRTLGAHAYRNPPDRHLDTTGQFLDSVNVPGHRFFTALWAPVGLRWHATHHLFMNLPYHNLAKAHWRLVEGLGADSLYRRAERRGLWHALACLWRETGANAR